MLSVACEMSGRIINRAFQVSGGPSWVGPERWDLQAKPEGIEGRLFSAQEAVIRALLEDRFQLKARCEPLV